MQVEVEKTKGNICFCMSSNDFPQEENSWRKEKRGKRKIMEDMQKHCFSNRKPTFPQEMLLFHSFGKDFVQIHVLQINNEFRKLKLIMKIIIRPTM